MQFLQLLATTNCVPVGRLQEDGVDVRCRSAQTVQDLLNFSRSRTKPCILPQHGEQKTLQRRWQAWIYSGRWNRVLRENSIRCAEGRTTSIERMHSGGRFV